MKNDNRIALVTGANKGIGLEIARQLAEGAWTAQSMLPSSKQVATSANHRVEPPAAVRGRALLRSMS